MEEINLKKEIIQTVIRFFVAIMVVSIISKVMLNFIHISDYTTGFICGLLLVLIDRYWVSSKKIKEYVKQIKDL